MADWPRGINLGVSNSPEMQRQKMGMWNSLPDAPSAVRPPTRAEHAFVNEATSPFSRGRGGLGVSLTREAELGHVTHGLEPSSSALYRVKLSEKASSAFWGKYLYTPIPRYEPRPSASTSGNFMGRAAYAASRILITRDDSGRMRPNTSYFLGALTLAAVHTSYRPYRARSTSAAFSDFGSTIGSNAGINVFHAFEPNVRQMVKGITPKFVSRIEERINRGMDPRDVVSIPAK